MKTPDDWLNSSIDEKIKDQIRKLQRIDPRTLKESFEGELAFGTGGIRGIMGPGPNRLNNYTIGRATQGLANYVNRAGTKSPLAVLIGYDNREGSHEFAHVAASVLAGNGILVFLTSDLRPTPFVSFAMQKHLCTAAIMITASHNTKEYNGYKVYWEDGGQVVSPHDQEVIKEVNQISSPDQIKYGKEGITYLDKSDDEAYLNALLRLKPTPVSPNNALSIIYSNLHGTGITFAKTALNQWGFENVHVVTEQEPTDGSFPAAPSPNPETKEALSLGIRDLEERHGDIFLANDPDADRVGCAVWHKGVAVILSGNQIAAILLHYLFTHHDLLPANGMVVTTIVTTHLLEKIAKAFGISTTYVLTGFKYISEKINEWQHSSKHTFLFGAEESNGCLFGTYARDKDGIATVCLLAEVAGNAKNEGLTLVDKLYEIYRDFGVYREMQVSMRFKPSLKGMQEMESIMTKLRQEPPKKIGDFGVLNITDYEVAHSDLPRSNVISLELENQVTLIIRPSGTEPKVKIYGMIHRQVIAPLEEEIKLADEMLDKALGALKLQLS